MTNNKPDRYLQQMYATDSLTWSKLLDSWAFHLLISYVPEVSLTLVRRTITNIITTRNNKWRRKYIHQLVDLLTSTSTTHLPSLTEYTPSEGILPWLGALLTVCNVSYTVPTVEVKLYNVSNSSSVTPVLIGDSIHYDSCLRTGVVQRYVQSNLYPPSTMTDDDILDLVSLNGTDYAGCNVEYLAEEKDAFDSGLLMYLVVGNMCNVNDTGPICRARVHVVTLGDSGEQVYVINKTYGAQQYTQQMYNHLMSLYPGKVYIYYRSNLCCTVGEPVSGSNITEYCDGYDEDAIYPILNTKQPVNSASISATNRSLNMIKLQVNNTIRTYYLHTKRADPIKEHPGYIRKSARRIPVSNYLCLVSSSMASVIVYLSNKYNLPYTYQCCSNYGTRMSSPLLSRCCQVEWTYNRVTYKIHEVRGTLKLTAITNGSSGKCPWFKGVYNFKRCQWDRVYTYNDDFTVSRHTLKYLDQFLPKRVNAAFLHSMSDM